MTAAAINVRLAELFIELAAARRALDTCPANERLTIANRIRVVSDEIHRGQGLLANTLPPTAGPEACPPGSSRSGQPEAAFLPYIQKVNR